MQRADPRIVLLATGGFGDHFNTTATPHRELVHRELLKHGVRVDVAKPADLLSSNTVEDALMVLQFSELRGVQEFSIVTSEFHVARCRFIFQCIAPQHQIEFATAEDSPCISQTVYQHESEALSRLVSQGGVKIGNVLHRHLAQPI